MERNLLNYSLALQLGAEHPAGCRHRIVLSES